jgi:hypothetical protein
MTTITITAYRGDYKFNRIDLCIKDTNISRVRKMARLLNIDVIGCPYQERTSDDIIYRVEQRPSATTHYRYLVVANNFEQLGSFSFQPNLVVVKDFEKVKSFIRKRKYKSKIALEVLLSDIRYQEGFKVGKWFREITDLYRFSKRYDCQFIISSGANFVWEMTSAQCFESIMRFCKIPPRTYWEELEEWLALQDRPRLSDA